MIINYTKDGMAHPDHMCEIVVRAAVDSGTRQLDVSTENIITCARALIAKGKVSHKNITFYHEGEFVDEPNADGRMSNWPKGFADHNDKWLMSLLTRE